MQKIVATLINTLLLISSSLAFAATDTPLPIEAPSPTVTEQTHPPYIIKSHAIAMHGKPKYPANFKGFDYTSPKATKGGLIRLYALGTYDSLNEFIAKGTPADKLDLIYDSLTVKSEDEPFSQYGILAQTIEYPEDRSWVIFHLRPEARFHDDHPITAEDIVFSFYLLKEKGNPFYGFYYRDVEKVEALSTHKVKYTFNNPKNRELVLSVGQLPVLPKHFWQGKAFDKSSLEIPLGSGPYRVSKVDPGRNITYERVKNYWGKKLAVNRGLYNFDYVSVDYYRDANVAIEALKAGEYDYRWENTSKSWATAYNIPSVRKGDLIKREIKHSANSGMQAFIFNLRKPIFQDIELRKAMSYAFDFEWSNNALFYGAYNRSYSYFTNSDFAATGLPVEKELALLETYKDQLPASMFNQAYAPPATDGSGRNRPNIRIAKKILDNAGYKVKDNQLHNAQGQAIRFEFLLVSPGFNRIVNPFIKNLSRLGINANIRLVDLSQYVNRTRSFDFDMMVHAIPQSESPGNEQLSFWGSEAAETEGSRNLIGIKNPVIDKLIEYVINTKDRDQLVTATRALDRVLLHNYYSIPHWYKASSSIVYWNKFSMPEIAPAYDRYYLKGIFTWWYDQSKADTLTMPAKPTSTTEK